MLWNWHFVDYYECFNGVNEFQTSSPLFKSEEWMFLVHDSTAEIYHNIVFTRFRIYCVVFRICSYSVFIGAKLSLKGKFVWEKNFLLLNWCPCFNGSMPYSVFIGEKLSLKGKFVWGNDFLLLDWCLCFNGSMTCVAMPRIDVYVGLLLEFFELH